GERSEEAAAWFEAVYSAVGEIPRGRVTSYGHIARLLGKLGVCLKHLPLPSTDSSRRSARWHSGNVPWQRVINAKGGISPRGPGSAARQAASLRREGVHVEEDSMGVFSVDLGRFGWFPDVLPSEVGDDEEGSSEDEDSE
ncbi:MGMT family protein, partial [Mytilinidion resinicola]